MTIHIHDFMVDDFDSNGFPLNSRSSSIVKGLRNMADQIERGEIMYGIVRLIAKMLPGEFQETELVITFCEKKSNLAGTPPAATGA